MRDNRIQISVDSWRQIGMKSYEQHQDAIKEELKGFGFTVYHHSDRKLSAILEVLIEIRDLLVTQTPGK
jgi:hypothetical protein